MRKAALKTYLYEIIFILVFKLSMDIFLRVSYFVYFLLWILSVIIMIYLFPYLILFLIGNHYLFVKLDPEKYILIVEKTYKIFKINIMKDFNRINLSVCYWLLNEKEKALKYLNEIKITRLTLPIIKYCYYRNLMEYKYFMGEKEEARKIFDENFRKSGEKLEIGIMLDYENNPQQKIIEFEKLLKGKRKLYQIEIKFNLAKTYEEIGNFEKAKELYKEVAEKGNKLYMGKIAQEKILELS